MTDPAPYPRAFAHIGISIPDLGAAVRWYQNVLGWTQIAPPGEISCEDGGDFGAEFADVLADVFGERCRHLRIAHMSAGNGVAVELFEFVEPPYVGTDDNFDYTRGGIFHFCVVDPDVEGLSQRIADTGGRIRSKLMRVFDDQPYYARYCEDPWGTILEVTSHQHAQIFGNQIS
ncbi:VOC family protein [Capillimicrobium parvum]|uniref:VOC domain-containing protein n=1 Tax=Capillimicrobium parvum TaxID=2884022 RepID=A0A9E6XRT1_9ACTN|nr:VOC family protein [Capillimicrobium parvum]UGS33684.1 hypothetical protein DSM104329_00049 [Capillimicrobium parvum]